MAPLWVHPHCQAMHLWQSGKVTEETQKLGLNDVLLFDIDFFAIGGGVFISMSIEILARFDMERF